MCDVFTDGDWIEAKDQSDSGIRLVQIGNVGITEYLDKANNKKWISEETFERLHHPAIRQKASLRKAPRRHEPVRR